MIKLVKEISLQEFDGWSQNTLDYLTQEEIKTVEQCLVDAKEGEPMSETELNDWLRFEKDTIAQWLGYSDFDEIMEREDN